MKELKRILANVNKRDFRLYLFFSILLVVTLVSFGKLNFTQAKYESETEVEIGPTLAFFVVDVGTTSGHIKLDGLVPSTGTHTFEFQVSNFTATKHANVDLTYTIEIVTTTNMKLNFKVYKGSDLQTDQIDSDTFSTNADGVWYRHLVINDVTTMPYNQNVTDTYTLEVEFPIANKNKPDAYAGVIDLVDIIINAEQVV